MPYLADPPPDNRGRPTHPEMLAAVQYAHKNPGRWVKLKGYWSNSVATRIKHGKTRHGDKRPRPFRGDYEWDAQVRTAGAPANSAVLYIKLLAPPKNRK